MNKLFTLALAMTGMALVANAQGITPPYESDMASANAGWTVINVEEGTPTFEVGGKAQFSGTGSETGYMYTPVQKDDGSYDAVNDWIVSPGIQLKAGVKYKIKYACKPSSRPDPTSSYTYLLYKLVAAEGNTLTDLREGTTVYDYNQQTNPDGWSKSYGGGRSFVYPAIVFTPERDGVYYFGFHLYGALFNTYSKSSAQLSLTTFQLGDYLSAVTPNVVGNFWSSTDTIAPNRVLSHKFAYRLDTLDTDRNKFPAEITYKNVKFYRNGELCATIENPKAGEIQVFVDDASKGLTPGKHTYKATCELSNGKVSAEATMAMSQWVGPVPEIEVPWKPTNLSVVSSLSFNVMNEWLSINSQNSSSYGYWTKSGSGANTVLRYSPKSNKADDAYLILPPVKFTKAGMYQLVSKIKKGHASQDGLEIHVVKGTPTTTEGFSEATSKLTFANDTYVHDYYNAFNIAEPGTYTVAIRRVSEKATSTNSIDISALAIEETALAPMPIADLKGEVVNDDAKLTWTNPTIDNIGNTLSEISKIEVIRYNNLNDTVVAATLTSGIAPGAAMTYTDKVENPFIYNYMVKAYIGENAHGQKPMTAFADYEWVGSKVQKLPYLLKLSGSHPGDWHQGVIIPNQKLWKFERNSDAYTQEFGLYTTYMQLYMTTNKVFNHRAVTPQFNLKKGRYKITVKLKGGWANMPLTVGYRNNDNEAAKGNVAIATGAYSTTERQVAPVYVDVKEDGVGSFVFSIVGTSPTSSVGAFNFTYFNIEFIPVIPNAATGLKVTPDANGERKALVEWKNPTTSSVAGNMPALTKILLFRNGTQIAELTEGLEAGKQMQYADNEVPDAGYFTYRVEVYSADGCADKHAEVRSAWIGQGKDLPYSPENDYSEWTSPAGHHWTINAGSLNYENIDDFDTDEWVFSPMFNLELGKFFVIDFKSWYGAGMDPTDITFHYGEGLTKEAMTHSLGTISVDTEREAEAKAHQILVKVVEPSAMTKAPSNDPVDYIALPAGHGAFAFHVGEGGTANIKDFTVSVNDNVVGIDAIRGENAIAIAGGIVSFNGNANVALYDLNGKMVISLQGVETLDINSLAKGVYILRANVAGENIIAKIVK